MAYVPRDGREGNGKREHGANRSAAQEAACRGNDPTIMGIRHSKTLLKAGGSIELG